MSKGEQKGSSFGQFINQVTGLILGIFGFISTVVGFVTLAQGNAGLVTATLIIVGISLLWLACLYFARFWMPEAEDGKGNKRVGLVPPAQDDKLVREQRRKRRRRTLVRRAALIGLILVPLLSLGGYGAWRHVQNLPNDDVVILVADFSGPDTQNNRVTETILRQLRDATEDYDDVEVVALSQAVSEQAGSDQARKLAEKKKADIMIWGWYGLTSDTVPISANFEVLETNEYLPDDLGDLASGAVQTFDVAELDSFSLQTRLSSNMSFLTLFTLGIADYANEDWTDAIALFEDALQQTDSRADGLDLLPIHFYQGNAYFYEEGFDEAIEAYDKALAIKPSDHEALNNKGSALTNLRKLDKAIKAYDKALAIKPDLHQALYNKGIALGKLGKLDEAIEAFDKAIAIKPDNHQALHNKGTTLGKLGKLDEAIEVYDKTLAIKPDLYQALYNKGNALAELGKLDEAIVAFDKTLAIKPDDHEALYNKGNALYELGKLDEAIVAFDKAITIKPDKHNALNNKGAALRNLGKLDEAIEAFDKALAIKPSDHAVLYNKGTTLGNLEKLDEAIEVYDKALAIKPDLYQALYNKARAHSLKNDTDNALQALQKAINLNPDYRDFAKTDTDLDNIRQNPSFQNLINSSS